MPSSTRRPHSIGFIQRMEATGPSSNNPPRSPWCMLRRLVLMLLRTGPGHRTVAPIAPPSAASSAARTSVRPTAPNFEAMYEPQCRHGDETGHR